MINVDHVRHSTLIDSVYKQVKSELETIHKLKVDNGEIPNSRRKIEKQDIEQFIDEYFKDLAVWLEEPNSMIFDMSTLGRIHVSIHNIDKFLTTVLIPKYRLGADREKYKEQIRRLWKLRSLKYDSLYYPNTKVPYKGKFRHTTKQQKQDEIDRGNREPRGKFGDSFSMSTPSLSETLLVNALSPNLDRKAFLDILNE
jgi:hypothetical protein